MRIGHGFDVHRVMRGRQLILGGVEIPFREGGLLGHSDADVAVHAIMDSILGALCLGDIGCHFPDDNERFKDASSITLLSRVGQIMSEQGYRIGNIDATIIAQAPKIGPFIPQMRQNVAAALGCGIDQINIKATTEEWLGYTGSREGMSAHAVCLLESEKN